MKEIPLTQGKVAIVDDEDYDFLSQFKWCAQRAKRNTYAVRSFRRNGRVNSVKMHRLLLDAPDGVEIDHMDHDGLNNTRENIRLCTRHEQARNSRKSILPKSSKYKGVQRLPNRWRAIIRIGGQNIFLGSFKTEVAAARAYNRKAMELFGEFAHLNVFS